MKHARPDDEHLLVERQEKRATTDKDHICCFGMLVDLGIKMSTDYHVQETPIALNLMDDSHTLFDSRAKTTFGYLDPKAIKIMSVLRQDLEVQLLAHSIASPEKDYPVGGRKSNARARAAILTPSLGLYVILYGSPALSELVGSFTSKCSLYLQHPWHCDRNVPYKNPHCLSPKNSDPVYTFDLNGVLDADLVSESEMFRNPIDLFADSAEQETLMDSATPQALCTELFKHQKQALTFMLQREGGWALKGHHKDIWKQEIDVFGRVIYFNTVSGQKQIRPPKEFRGGLLIDAPGLGKSLSIIALIASTRESQQLVQSGESLLTTTLLVVPKTLIQTWKDELRMHVKSTSTTVTFCVYYGKDRLKYLEELHKYSLVITTYSVVRLDWKAKLVQSENCPTLHGVNWGRIVLDEGANSLPNIFFEGANRSAHIIREPTKSYAKSVCALQAECRWAVTGTPIQNRLRDLFSLFKFLQCSPFDDFKVFNIHVAQMWKAKSDPNAVAKLKTLVNCLSLRRPKTIIDLPPRADVTIKLDFSEQEKEYHELVKNSTRRKIRLIEGNNGSAAFMNVLQWVNELRLICNHGTRNQKAVLGLKEAAPTTSKWTEQEAQTRFDQLDQVGLAKCSNPECSQDLTSALSSETDTDHIDEPRFEESLELLCSSCFLDRSGRAGKFFKVCNHLPRRTMIPSGQDTPSAFFGPDVEGNIPSKILKLVQDLSDTPERIKSVVFSSWTKTFDIIQPQLMAKGIRCVRLDGTLSATTRASVIRVFRTNPDIKVLLATITCGGVGLDLTAASRAYIVEPQWNPMSESQALDRIHRLGQKNEVKTIRYVMKGSWEEQVLTLQKRKQDLADLTLSAGTINRDQITLERLKYLKELVG